LGGLLAALYLAGLAADANLKKVLIITMFMFGAALLLFAYTPWLGGALALLVVSAFGMMAQTTVNFTLLQTLMLPAMRGRVISLYVLMYAAAMPLGSVLVGAVSQRVGVRPTVLAEGILALGIGLLYVRNRRQPRLVPPLVPAAPQPEIAEAIPAA
jgi:predicted MFS family arabinose efflux permease